MTAANGNALPLLAEGTPSRLWLLSVVGLLVLVPALALAQAPPAPPFPAEAVASPDETDPTATPGPEAAGEEIAPGEEIELVSDEGTELDDADEATSDVITVVGRSITGAPRRSAYAVTVVDTEQAKRLSADLGDVLAKDTPVTVQRVGGLGSRGSFSLGGMGGERLRFFLDSVPLELMGYSAGPANVPVNLVDRVDVYQGMVPIRLAGDALGGAINFVTDQRLDKSAAAASYQIGSFGTHRATLSARYVHRPSGAFVRASGFFDTADNDYTVDVETWNEVGQLEPAEVSLFHNGYRGRGVNLALGVAGQPWADLLVVQGFLSAFDNDVQSGLTMGRPYGEVTFERGTSGANFKYALSVGPAVLFEAVGGYAHMDARFRDLSRCLYDWYGNCNERTVASVRGEVSGRPTDREIVSDTLFLRPILTADLNDSHQLRLALTPTYLDRRGEHKTRSQEYDPLSQPRRLFTGVAGAELESRFFHDDRVTNILSAKGYMLKTESQELLANGDWRDLSRTMYHAGAGDSVRVRLFRGFTVKASYEYALRMPSADELYGDGDRVLESLDLRPETSHNINAGLAFTGWYPLFGTILASVDGFVRYSDDFIAPLSSNDYVQNVNIWDARMMGVEARLEWTVPHGDWLTLDGRFTYQDLRNRSTSGELGELSGDRIPSTPYLFANGGARLRGRDLVWLRDTVELAYSTRYVHSYLRGWESLARNADRLEIDSQLTHGVSLLHTLEWDEFVGTATIEVQNLTDERVFDFYGLQRPGRSFHAKFTVQL